MSQIEITAKANELKQLNRPTEEVNAELTANEDVLKADMVHGGNCHLRL